MNSPDTGGFDYPYPPTPPDCMNYEDPATLGVACVECPLIMDATVELDTGCGYLDAGRRLARAEHDTQAVDGFVGRVVEMRNDILVDNAYTPEGLRDLLTHDEDMQAELAEGKWGVIRLDGRFVGRVNQFGNLVGDHYLQSSGDAIGSAAQERTRHAYMPAPVTPDRRYNRTEPSGFEDQSERLNHPVDKDILCRQGGDEFALIIRNVDSVQLTRVASRVASRLGVAAALERYEAGQPPFIASVGITHASQAEARPDDTDWYDAFETVNAAADAGQIADKHRQYQDMWERTCAAEPALAGAEQPADREVASLFLRHLCPDFYNDPPGFLGLPEQS